MNFTSMNEAFKNLKEYWFILIFIGSLIVGWTNFNARISTNEKAIEAVQSQQATQNLTLVTLQTNLAEIKATLDYIKNNISR